MEQINGYAFFQLAWQLKDCHAHARLPLRLWAGSAAAAQKNIEALLRGDAKFKLEESRQAAEKLNARLTTIIAVKTDDNVDAHLTEDQVSSFNSDLYVFDQAISLELGRAPVFYVTPKGIYDTRRLIGDAAEVFEGYRSELPKETIEDTNAAGRCLAFTLPTAAGFHIARATEAVIKQYMSRMGCPPPKDSQRNWGKYADLLEAKGADPKIVHHIRQLKDLHRNPMVHPEESLTMPEAQSLWSMCVSLIQAMSL